MSTDLLLPLMFLCLIAAGWIFVAYATKRQKQLSTRLADVVSSRPVMTVADQVASIRVKRQESQHLARVARLLKVPADLPLAHVLPPPVIFAIGTIVACVATWLDTHLTSLTMSLIEGGIAWVFIVRGTFGWEIARYRAMLVRQLPDTIQLVVSATRAGLPIAEAFRAIAEETASPTRDEFARAEREMAMGSTPDEALLSLHERTGVPEYAIFAVTIGVQARSGGRLAETIQNLAETVRERLQIAARAKALSGEAMASAVIMCILPVVCGVLLSILDPAHMALLFHDPRGVRMFSFGVITLLLGIVSMRHMIKGATKD